MHFDKTRALRHQLTEKVSLKPVSRKSHAHSAMDTTKATEPSTVLFVPIQRIRPMSLPTIEACRLTQCQPEFQRGSNTTTHHRISDAKHQHARVSIYAVTFEPQASSTTREQVEMAQDDGPRIFRVDKFGKEDVQWRADGVKRKVAGVFREGEQSEGDRKGEGGEGRLRCQGSGSVDGLEPGSAVLTSMAMPGTNIATANA